jgi:hypothetical protein
VRCQPTLRVRGKSHAGVGAGSVRDAAGSAPCRAAPHRHHHPPAEHLRYAGQDGAEAGGVVVQLKQGHGDELVVAGHLQGRRQGKRAGESGALKADTTRASGGGAVAERAMPPLARRSSKAGGWGGEARDAPHRAALLRGRRGAAAHREAAALEEGRDEKALELFGPRYVWRQVGVQDGVKVGPPPRAEALADLGERTLGREGGVGEREALGPAALSSRGDCSRGPFPGGRRSVCARARPTTGRCQGPPLRAAGRSPPRVSAAWGRLGTGTAAASAGGPRFLGAGVGALAGSGPRVEGQLETPSVLSCPVLSYPIPKLGRTHSPSSPGFSFPPGSLKKLLLASCQGGAGGGEDTAV